MEDIIEKHKRFRAQYLSQKVLRNKKGTYLEYLKPRHLMFNTLDISFLELTPLSMISDEDAIEVGALNGNLTSKNNLLVGKSMCHWLNVQGTNRDIPFEAIDFLRSKGYALPFNGISVEQQIEYGWIKLKISE